MARLAATILMLIALGGGVQAAENRPSAGWCDARGKQWQLYEFVELARGFYCEITRLPEPGETLELRSNCRGEGRFLPLRLTLRHGGGRLTIAPSGEAGQEFGSALRPRTYWACAPR